MEEEKAKAKRGPKPIYEKDKPYNRGAPRLVTRLLPSALDWVESRPEGVRPYLERIIFEDRDRCQSACQPETLSTSPDDVPGQLLFPEGLQSGKKQEDPKTES